jgi:membrane-associated phospholipid phosphatase
VLRRSEIFLLAYYIYAAGVALALPLPGRIAALTVAVNLAVVLLCIAVAYASRRSRHPALGMVRDLLPLALVLLAYRQMGWFAPVEHTFELERSWVTWDRLLLNAWGVQDVIESLGPVLPAVLELAYALVYAIGPFCVALLYIYRRVDRMDRFLLVYLTGTMLSYALFPYFPSEPPRAVFPGDLFPSIDTVFRRFNWWLLAGGGIHTSVFPSAHVSSAYAAAFGMMRALPEKKWAGRFLLVHATLICVATVYGRYHYAVDGVAGIAVSLLALGLVELVERFAGSPRPDASRTRPL